MNTLTKIARRIPVVLLGLTLLVGCADRTVYKRAYYCESNGNGKYASCTSVSYVVDYSKNEKRELGRKVITFPQPVTQEHIERNFNFGLGRKAYFDQKIPQLKKATEKDQTDFQY